jgi:7,8-dihydropterin-6-yl-methyl-4-(beta-D-ribofuranosyl)aminobenzene 5'-phosphate synthase
MREFSDKAFVTTRDRTRYWGLVLALIRISLAAQVRDVQSAAPRPRGQVQVLKVTILSTMLADAGIGEWGFAALVEADGHRVLVDTGARPNTVLENARELGVDLSSISEVILTHFHDDHVGGLVTLRRELMKKNPMALAHVHVGKGIFYSRPGKDGNEQNSMIAVKREYEGMRPLAARSSSVMPPRRSFPACG